MKLTKGVLKESLLLQFGFTDSKTAIALNSKDEIVECISYDSTCKDPKGAIITSMIYNGWIEDGRKQSAYKYGSPKSIYQSFKVIVLNTDKERKIFLSKLSPN